MDFVHDQLVNGQAFRVLTVVDNWSRESLVLEVGFRLTGSSVVEALSRVGKTVRLPACITVDHGTEFTSRALDFWAWENKVQLDFTRPGKPTDNGLCESFNGRLRDECLNTHEFESLQQAQRIIGVDSFSWTLNILLLGVHMPKTHLPYPAEFRQQIIELVRAGRTPAELSREFRSPRKLFRIG